MYMKAETLKKIITEAKYHDCYITTPDDLDNVMNVVRQLFEAEADACVENGYSEDSRVVKNYRNAAHAIYLDFMDEMDDLWEEAFE